MDKWKMRRFLLTGVTACSSFLFLYAQPVIKTSVDKREILIGDQFKLKIEAGIPPEAYRVKWPVIPDSLAHFEVVDRGRIDSVYSDEKLTGMVQTLTLTSFDSGRWVLPSFLVSITGVTADTTYNFFTDSVPVTVSFSTADTSRQLRDIKPIREVSSRRPWWHWAAALLAVSLIVLAAWYLWKRKPAKTVGPVQSRLSPYDEAMKELESLKKYDRSLPGDIRIVHTRLAEILKQYLSKKQNSSYHNKTTGDTLILLSDHYPGKDMLAQAAASLRCGDAVKFAKYLPPPGETEECIRYTTEVVKTIHRQSPERNPPTVNLKS